MVVRHPLFAASFRAFFALLSSVFLCASFSASAAPADRTASGKLFAGDAPLQIESRQTSREGNLAIAQGDVVIAVGDTVIYCDYAQCDTITRDVMVSGDVRIYRGDKIFSGDRAIYNLDTKRISGSEFRTAAGPFMAQAHSLVSTGPDTFEASGGLFTTDNSSDPGFHLRARKVRIFRNNHTEYEDVMVYVGRTPVFWLPYLYQPSSSDQSFSIAPGSRSNWGAFLLTRFAFPVSADTIGGLRLDYLSKRGAGFGVDLAQDNKATGSWGRLRSYYIDDQTPGNKPPELGSPTNPIDPKRFRVSIQDRSFLSETVYTTINFNKLSDINFYRDFSPSELQRDPNPESVFALTHLEENHALTLEMRKQFNNDYESNDALPSLALDLKRQPILGSKVFYDGETTVAKMRRKQAKENPGNTTTPFDFFTYDTVRLDSFHQLTYPQTWGGWLSVVPKVGVRATHYSASLTEGRLAPGDPLYGKGGALDRFVGNLGIEASFKLSRSFESVENRNWGLDGLRHIFQPFGNLSLVSASDDPTKLLPIDTLNPSSKLPAIDFPQFNSVDSITSWDILRFGVRNRLQTRRDEETLNWLELESFMDMRIKQPEYGAAVSADAGAYSNLSNRLRWNPLPWLGVDLDSQLPVVDEGFSEFNSSSNVQLTRDLTVNLGNRYVSGNRYFNNSNLVTGGARLRMSDNWTVGFEENYEFVTKNAEYQRYSLDRDLRSWIASLSLVLRENATKNDVAVLLTLTLKDIPKFKLPLHFDPEAASSSSSSKNR